MESILLRLARGTRGTLRLEQMRNDTRNYSQTRESNTAGWEFPTLTPAILVAEGESTSRVSLSELLREEGYRVVEAADSATAIMNSAPTQVSRLSWPIWKCRRGPMLSNTPAVNFLNHSFSAWCVTAPWPTASKRNVSVPMLTWSNRWILPR